MFDFLKPKSKEKKKIYVLIDTDYPEFINNVKVLHNLEDVNNYEFGDAMEYDLEMLSEDGKLYFEFQEE